jgi:hypothetical protein
MGNSLFIQKDNNKLKLNDLYSIFYFKYNKPEKNELFYDIEIYKNDKKITIIINQNINKQSIKQITKIGFYIFNTYSLNPFKSDINYIIKKYINIIKDYNICENQFIIIETLYNNVSIKIDLNNIGNINNELDKISYEYNYNNDNLSKLTNFKKEKNINKLVVFFNDFIDINKESEEIFSAFNDGIIFLDFEKEINTNLNKFCKKNFLFSYNLIYDINEIENLNFENLFFYIGKDLNLNIKINGKEKKKNIATIFSPNIKNINENYYIKGNKFIFVIDNLDNNENINIEISGNYQNEKGTIEIEKVEYQKNLKEINESNNNFICLYKFYLLINNLKKYKIDKDNKNNYKEFIDKNYDDIKKFIEDNFEENVSKNQKKFLIDLLEIYFLTYNMENKKLNENK